MGETQTSAALKLVVGTSFSILKRIVMGETHHRLALGAALAALSVSSSGS